MDRKPAPIRLTGAALQRATLRSRVWGLAGALAALVIAPAAALAQASSAASVSPAASVPPGVATPVGANPAVQQQEPVSMFAYLLIALAVLWFLIAVAGIIRLMTTPARGPYAQLPPSEADRHFLSFGMPFVTIITVAIIVGFWGILFLFIGSYSEVYTLAVDLLVVCGVMLIATMAALRASRQHRSALQ